MIQLLTFYFRFTTDNYIEDARSDASDFYKVYYINISAKCMKVLIYFLLFIKSKQIYLKICNKTSL